MNIATKVSGFALATAAAAIFVAAPMASAKDSSSTVGHCMGVNACKGRSSCKTAQNSCKGDNSCKGKGFVKLTKEQCDQVGGTYEPGD